MALLRTGFTISISWIGLAIKTSSCNRGGINMSLKEKIDKLKEGLPLPVEIQRLFMSRGNNTNE